jgi:hypothetical protein
MKKMILLLILLPLQVLANSENFLSLYFIPSPHGIDWTTPSTLAWTAIKNRLSMKSRFMGHVFVELQCGEDQQLTGMRGKNFDYVNQLFINNRGLGILYHSFDGTLEEKEESQQEIKELSEEGERINFVRFKLNQHQCLRAKTYLKEYREKNVGRYYGLANRPLHAEGAGCSAFGASFIEVTGLMNQDMKDAWSHTINIPLEFAGPPLKDEGVNFFKLVFNASRWADLKEPHKQLMFWSPDLMFSWVKDKISKIHEQKEFSVIQMAKAKGLWVDKSYLPSPSGPIWQQHLDASLKTNSTVSPVK